MYLQLVSSLFPVCLLLTTQFSEQPLPRENSDVKAPNKRAVAAIQKLGGSLRRDGKGPTAPIVAVDLTACSAGNADLKCLGDLPHLLSADL